MITRSVNQQQKRRRITFHAELHLRIRLGPELAEADVIVQPWVKRLRVINSIASASIHA